jgi:hypothetical protein
MAPFRWYYQLTRFISITEPFANNQTNGMHWLMKLLYQFVSFVQPSTLQLL